MTSPTRPGLVGGLVVLALYLSVAAVTVRVTGHHVRPLFDGVQPAPRYRWVNPPKAFAAGNVVPKVTERDESLGPAGSPQDGIPSADGQLVLNLPAGAIPPDPSAGKASVTITPLDPATLGPLPGGAAPDGNAYRVEVTSGQPPRPVTTLAKPGTALLTVPQPSTTVFSSPDGREWQPVETFPTSDIMVSIRMPSTGWFLASAAPIAVTAATSSAGDTARTVAVAGLTAALALVLALAPAALRRLRRRGPGAGPGAA